MSLRRDKSRDGAVKGDLLHPNILGITVPWSQKAQCELHELVVRNYDILGGQYCKTHVENFQSSMNPTDCQNHMREYIMHVRRHALLSNLVGDVDLAKPL